MKKYLRRITDDSMPIQDRIFTLLSTVGMLAMCIMFLVGIIIGESATDLLTLGIGLLVFGIMLFLALRFKIVHILAPLCAFMIIFILLPVTFFSGGGIYGGSPLWFVFCTLFVTMLINGKLKYILIALDAVMAAVCYILAYTNPGLVTEHNTGDAYLDSFISIIFVCGMLCLMVGFEISILKSEMEKSRKKSEEIEDLSESQNRFFSTMSHEIRTPINTIIGLNEMILREDISDEVAEDAKNIRSSSKVLLSVINDILDMSRIASGRMEIVPVSYDVAGMLSEIVNMMWARAHEKGLDFSIDIDPNLPAMLFGDEVRIRQILINLLGNAVKYTEEGSVSLSIHCAARSQSHVTVTYSVEDTGMGIRKENMPYLFDAFRRVDEKSNRRIEGTGLGLSIVKQLTDLMGGEITVNSVYTKGSTFAVTLEQEIVGDETIGRFDPSKRAHGDERDTYRHTFEAPDATVLIVDDNSANLLVEKKLLRKTKMQVETADSGRACLELTLEKHYDVILMDHLMPEMDGIECLGAIRDQAGGMNRETPVIVLTANAGSENQALYQRAGFDDYVQKPVDGAVLEEAILALLPSEVVRIQEAKKTENADSGGILRQNRRRIPLLITTDSVSDIPQELVQSMKIRVLPYKVYTQQGIFTDGIEAGGDVIIRQIKGNKISAKSEAPSVEDYEVFFAKQLSEAQHVLHIAMGKRSSKGYENACEAALSFYNVRVVDSGHLSSGMGLMVMAARDYATSGIMESEQIAAALEKNKEKIHTSFIVDSTEYLYFAGRLSQGVHKLCTALLIHPVIVLKDSAMKVGTVILGSRQKARERYIKMALAHRENIDRKVLFITYVGMKKSEVEEVRDMALKIVPFEKVYLQKASPAISINCGPGTFGLIFSEKIQ